MNMSLYENAAQIINEAWAGGAHEPTRKAFEQIDTNRAIARQKDAAFYVWCSFERVRLDVIEAIQVGADRAKIEIHGMAHAARLSLGQKHRRRMERGNHGR